MFAAALVLAFGPQASEAPVPPRPALDAATAAARWIARQTIETEHGVTWPPVVLERGPGERGPETSLYSGAPGVVLFLLALEAAGGGAEWGRLGRRGADELVAELPANAQGIDAGLWTGVGGVGFALLEAGRFTGAARYSAGAVRAAELLHAVAERTEHGVRWSDVNDVIGGAAGTGFFLLRAARDLNRPEDAALAARAGRHLIAIADAVDGGLDWPMTPAYARRMPNFSHGTAGVATFLAALYEATGDEAFRDAAIAGARHVLALAVNTDGALRVPHHLPGGEDLFYLGWCHGPAGTQRLFRALAAATGAAEWSEHAEACARTLAKSGLPAARSAGYWNNVGPCCGAAGIAEVFLARGSDEDLAFARALLDDVLARGTRVADTLHWVQAEHRVQPEPLQAQTGFMQGAAGIGLALLHLDAVERGLPPPVRFPDDPF
jgi:lantibiotic modifying enzyme